MFKHIIAHRGESIECPENTIPSYNRAFELGADGIECDLQLTKDNVGVMFHDRTLEKKTGEKTTVSELEFAELRERDLGSWKSPKWSDVTIASLEETLAIMPGDKVIHIEFKCSMEGVAVLAKAVESTQVDTSQITLTGFDLEIGKACKSRFPSMPFLLNGLEFDFEEIVRSGIDGIATYYDHDIFEQVLARNLQYRMGNINTREDIQIALEHGVEYIDTDDIACVVAEVREKKTDR